MTNIDYMWPQIVYNNLLTTIYEEYLKKTSKSFIILTSPWIREINFSSLGLGEGIRRVLANVSQENLSSISSVLSCYLKATKPNLSIITQNYNLDSPAIEKKDKLYNLEEIRLLRALSLKGAHIYLHNDLHAKLIVTNIAAISGSANVTNLGLFGHTENVHYFDTSDLLNYPSTLRRGQSIIKESAEIDSTGLLKLEKDL